MTETRRRVAMGLGAMLLACLAAGGQAPPKRVYLAVDDHTDYFWSADDETYRKAFIEMLDYYLDLADRTAKERPEHQSRFACDGSYWMWAYEKGKSPAEFQRLIDRIKDGHISVPLNALAVCLGGAPAEAVLRGMYYPGQIERRYGVRFRLAYAMENQTMPFGLGALWAGAGARWSWNGICGGDTRVPDAASRPHEIYWWAGPDGSRLLMRWHSMAVGNQHLGGYAEARNPAQVVDYVTTEAERNGFRQRYPYDVIGAFGKGWDDLKTLSDEFVRVAKAKTDETRTVIVSNEEDFFRDFEATYGDKLPTVSASFGNEWDSYCAAMAEVSARVKRAIEKLRAAEALATLVALKDPGFLAGRETARDLAWMDLGLFWEQNWGLVDRSGDLVEKRIRWQRRIASEIEAYVDALHADAQKALGKLIKKNGANGENVRFYAFNPLSWTRTDAADLPYADAAPVQAIDLTTGQEVPSQRVKLSGKEFLRILAQDVPPVGYKVFEIRSGAGKTFPDAARVIETDLENALYRVRLRDNGAITKLVDLTRGQREFVRPIGGRAINDLGPGKGRVEAENAGPVSVTLRATVAGPPARTTRLTLFRDSRRIDLRNEITQNFADVQVWSFGFNLDAPDVWHEEVGAIAHARLVTDGGHYAPRCARYDWLTLNHFADMTGATDGSGRSVGVTLSNADCYFMRLGQSTPRKLDTYTPQVSVLAGGRVAGDGRHGIRDQGGDSYFLQRFALATHDAYDPAAAMRFALEHQNPLVTGLVAGGGAYPDRSFSLLGLSDPGVLLWALKPAEEGLAAGLIARVWNVAANPTDFTLQMPFPLARARRTSHIETNVEDATTADGALSAHLAPQMIRTFRLFPAPPR